MFVNALVACALAVVLMSLLEEGKTFGSSVKQRVLWRLIWSGVRLRHLATAPLLLLACGALGYYLVEKPSARLKRRFERRAASTSARGEPARLGHDSMSCPVLANAPPRMAGRGRDRE